MSIGYHPSSRAVSSHCHWAVSRSVSDAVCVAPSHPRQKYSPLPSADFLKVRKIGKHLVVLLQYAGVTHYEGKKVVVYLNAKLKRLKRTEFLDPHFSERGLSPFARFEPTRKGWRQAVKMVKRMKH